MVSSLDGGHNQVSNCIPLSPAQTTLLAFTDGGSGQIVTFAKSCGQPIADLIATGGIGRRKALDQVVSKDEYDHRRRTTWDVSEESNQVFLREPRAVFVGTTNSSDETPDLQSYVELSNQFRSQTAPAAAFKIRTLPTDDRHLAYAKRQFIPNACGIEFSVSLRGGVLEQYKTHTLGSLAEDGISKEIASRRSGFGSENYSIRDTFLNRTLFDDLTLFSHICVVSGFLAQQGNFLPRSYDAETSTRGTPLYRNFPIYVSMKDFQPERFSLEQLDLAETITFILKASENGNLTELNPFIRGLNYLIRALSHHYNSASTLLWAISAIECFLTDPSERSTTALLTGRLKALLEGENADNAVGEFRKLYKFRSSFLHGAQDIPIWLGEALTFPKGLRKPEQMLGTWKESSTATAIALKVAQKMVQRRMVKLEWETRLRS